MKVSLDRFFTIILGIFVLYFSLNEIFLFSEEVLSYYVFIGILLFIILILILYFRIDNYHIYILIPYVFYLLLYLFNNNGEFTEFFYQLLAGVLFFLCSNLIWKKKNVQVLAIISSLLFIPLFNQAFSYSTEIITAGETDYANINTIAVLMFVLSYFIYLYMLFYQEKNNKLSILVFSILLLVGLGRTGSRTSLLAIIVVIITALLWEQIIKNKSVFYGYFITIITIILAATFLYPYASEYSRNFPGLNNFIFELTGKELYTGREILWKETIDLIAIKPIFGYGSGVTLDDFWHNGLSSHNLFLQIALQSGYLGLSLFISFLFLIWTCFWRQRNRKTVILSAAFFIGIIIYQNFEVLLVLSSVRKSILLWFVIGIMTSYSNELSTEYDSKL